MPVMTMKKQILKIITDILMTVALLLLMAYSLIGEATHEWIGAALLVLFVIHHCLNGKWSRNLFRGKYTMFRVFQTILVLLVSLCMAGAMASGIVLSRYVLDLDIHGFSSIARTIHMICAYWGYVLLSLHLGLHWRMMMGMAGKLTKRPSNARKWILRGLAVLIAVYGLYAFVKRNLGNYMLLRQQFVFFDFEEPLVFFLLDYTAIMGLFVCIGHYMTKWIFSVRRKRNISTYFIEIRY